MKPIKWENSTLVLIDQTKLPIELEYVKCRNFIEAAIAIKEMKVRGAPAIGAAAAYGMVLGAKEIEKDNIAEFLQKLKEVGEALKNTRPTAVNLFWAVNRMEQKAKSCENNKISEIAEILENEANEIAKEDIEANIQMGQYGNSLVKKGYRILTHCNAGALATVGYGTALGVIRAAHEDNKEIEVFSCETRPFLQGARLTAWELKEDNIPVTVITDNMAGYIMNKGLVHMVVVGADRVAKNGDVANKIGTYSLAVLAKENNIPFYVAAPLSTIDMSTETGEDIIIEERDYSEVTHIQGKRITPEGVKIMNPAFDITPNELITGIITNKGIASNPYEQKLKLLASK